MVFSGYILFFLSSSFEQEAYEVRDRVFLESFLTTNEIYEA